MKLREKFYESKEMNECIFILNGCYALKRRKHSESNKNEAKHIWVTHDVAQEIVQWIWGFWIYHEIITLFAMAKTLLYERFAMIVYPITFSHLPKISPIQNGIYSQKWWHVWWMDGWRSNISSISHAHIIFIGVNSKHL